MTTFFIIERQRFHTRRPLPKRLPIDIPLVTSLFIIVGSVLLALLFSILRYASRVRMRAVQLVILFNILAGLAIAARPVSAQGESAGSSQTESTSQATVVKRDTSPLEERLTRVLVEDGFANVATVVEDGRVAVVYENARYRDPRRALQRAAELLQPELLADQELVLVPTVTAIPILSAHYYSPSTPDAQPHASPSAVSLDVSDLPAELLRVRRSSSSFGRVDIVLHPWFDASFGDYDNPIASRSGIAPEVTVALRPGLTLSAQTLFTIQDDLPTGDSRVRPGVITLNQTVRLPHNVFVSATAGTFTNDRYGVDVEATAYTNSGRWSVGAQAGLTGASSYTSRQWRFSSVSAPTALVSFAGRSPRYRTTIRATAGVFLDDQRGVRMDVGRRIGEFELGWFGVATPDGANGGITLRIPLPQRQYARPAPVRLRAAEWFRWQYRYRGLVSGGRPYTTGSSVEEFRGGMEPYLIGQAVPIAR